MNECPECGAAVTPGDASCPSCGHLHTPAACDRHPARSAAGRCVLCGRALCEDCDRGRRPYHLCEQHANVPMIEGWAELLSLSEEFEARLIEENLRAEGIDARILDQKDHSAFPVDIGDLARIRILVEPAAYARAERIISAHSDAAGEVSFGCPHCGEPYDEGEKVCGSCGEALV